MSPTTVPGSVLVCLSTAPSAPALAGEAVALARLFGASLHVIHAGPDTAATRERLREIVREAGWNDDVNLMLRTGAPHAAVLAAAGEINAGLLVAGALEKDGITKEIFGSTARRVARRVHCPLFLFTEPVVGGTPYRRIAVSTQTDQPTARALDFTLELARRAATEEIHVLHEKNYFDRLASRYASESYEARLARPPAPPELQTFLEGFDFGRAALRIQELEDGEGIAAVEHGRRHQTDLLVYPAPSRPLTFWDRFFNHPVELVLGRLPSALLIHRCPTGQAERGPRA